MGAQNPTTTRTGSATSRISAQWTPKTAMASKTKMGVQIPMPHLIPWRLVFCEIVMREDGKLVDAVWTLLKPEGEAWLIVGSGEDKEQVLALANR